MEGSLLVLETSCGHSSIVALIDGAVAARADWVAERNHASAIFQPLEGVMRAIKGREPAEILAGPGPGSYGGVRVALAVADGLALANGGRVTAFCSWNGLGIADAEAYVISDARRGGWAWGYLVNGVMNAAPQILTAEQTCRKMAECSEQGVPVYTTETAEKAAECGIRPACVVQPDAEALGRLWLKMSEEEKSAFRARPAEPLYVRAPHITNSKRPAWAVKA